MEVDSIQSMKSRSKKLSRTIQHLTKILSSCWFRSQTGQNHLYRSLPHRWPWCLSLRTRLIWRSLMKRTTLMIS